VSAFRVDPAALLAVVDRISEFDQELEGHLSHAANSVAQLGTSWYGAGSVRRARHAASVR
jgi:ESAT-6 family protein